MSEFKFACPVCGQHIKCDSSQSGTTMECPTCFQKIVAPLVSATQDAKLILTGTKSGERPASTAFGKHLKGGPAAGRSWLPAGLRKFPVATLMVLMALLGVGALLLVSFNGKIFRPESPADNRKTPGGATDRPGNWPDGAASGGGVWTLDVDAMTIPTSAAAGFVHGKILVPQRVILDAGTLTLRTANPGLPDAGISIYFRATRGENLAGQRVEIKTNSSQVPWVDLRWKNEQGQLMKQTIKGGYAMRAEFGLPDGDRLPGKIYLCLPDETKSYVAGEFNAKVRKPKSAR